MTLSIPSRLDRIEAALANLKNASFFIEAGRTTRRGLMDFLLNSLEHEPSFQAAVETLVSLGYDPKFSQMLMDRWEKERPDLKRPTRPGQLALLVAEAAVEDLVDSVMQQTHVRYR